MGKIFVLMGKSATGKDSIFKKLVEHKDITLKTIISYTTRPIRQGEANGSEYYFVSEDQMNDLKEQGNVIECRTYKTIHGDWNYFTVNDGQIDLNTGHYIIIGTLEAFLMISEYYGREAVMPIYIEVDDGERLKRSIHREDKQTEPNYAEVCRRFLADEEDFSQTEIEKCGIIKRYKNQKIESCVDEIVRDIKKIM